MRSDLIDLLPSLVDPARCVIGLVREPFELAAARTLLATAEVFCS